MNIILITSPPVSLILFTPTLVKMSMIRLIYNKLFSILITKTKYENINLIVNNNTSINLVVFSYEQRYLSVNSIYYLHVHVSLFYCLGRVGHLLQACSTK